MILIIISVIYCLLIHTTGEELFNESIGNQTTDSITATAWLHAKRTAPQKTHPALKRAEVLLKAFATEIASIEVRHWDNAGWGETPADFGEKS